jgi:hypothetical protein
MFAANDRMRVTVDVTGRGGDLQLNMGAWSGNCSREFLLLTYTK